MRNTPLLMKVLALLKKSSRPLSVPDIQKALSKSAPNKTSLYRMMEKLEKEGVVEALLLNPRVTFYEYKTHHHHHFLCEKCSTITCLTDSALEARIHALEKKLTARGLRVSEHHFSLSGVCSACH